MTDAHEIEMIDQQVRALRAQRDELLAALEATVPYVEQAYECAFPDERENSAVLEQARMAIAKARGGKKCADS